MNSDSSLLSSQHNQTSKDSLTQLQQQDFWTTDTLRARGELNWFQRCEGRPLQHRQFTSTSLFLTTMFLQSHCFPALSESSLLTVRMAKRPSRHKQRHTGQGRLLYSKCCSHPSHQRMRINAWFLQLYIPVMTEQIKTAWTVSQGLLVKKFLQQKQPPPLTTHTAQDGARGDGLSWGWSPGVDGDVKRRQVMTDTGRLLVDIFWGLNVLRVRYFLARGTWWTCSLKGGCAAVHLLAFFCTGQWFKLGVAFKWRQ